MIENEWMREQGTAKVVSWTLTMASKDWMRHGRNWLEMAGGDEEYAVWLVLCDQRMGRLVGIGIFDIGDWTWADGWESGMSPAEAVVEALRADDTYSALFDGAE